MTISQARTLRKSDQPRDTEPAIGCTALRGAPPAPVTESLGCRFPRSSGLGEGHVLSLIHI
eukprot:3858383-Alexandrium_andersonii.AAC.1